MTCMANFMRTSIRVLLIVVLSAFFLAGCSKSGDDVGMGTFSDKVTDSASKNDAGSNQTTNSGSSDNGKIGEQKLDLGDLSSETLTEYPKETTPSMYYYNAKKIDEEVFFPDHEEIYGDPYYFNGTILEELSINETAQELSNYSEFGALIANIGADGKFYKIMTELGEVVVIDPTPYMIQYLNDYMKSQANTVYGLAYYKTWYNNLMPYKKMPEVGDTGKFYGFLYGYSQNYDCPIFSYGVGNLSRAGFFNEDYPKYRSDVVKKKKYRSLINYSYPVGWSEPEESGGDIYIYTPENLGYIGIYDYEDAEMTVEDAIKLFTGEATMELPEDFEGMDDMPVYDPSEWVKVKNKEKITIGDGSISAYHVDISYKYDDGTWHDETAVAFKAKRSVVVIYLTFYQDDSTDEYEGTTLAGDVSDYLDEEDTNSDVTEDDDEEVTSGEEDPAEHRKRTKQIVLDEFEEILKSIEILGL